MHERWTRGGDLGVTRLLWAFAVLSVVLLATLALVPLEGHMTEWRAAQQRYNELVAARGLAPMQVGLQQIWKPELDVTDRCTSCHVAMAGGEPIGTEKLFAAHPPIPHDPADFGCTVCHAGQGRATGTASAHGQVKHWADPVLERKYAQAGCGTCHANLPAPSAAAAVRGEALFRRHDCLACHRVDGAGRGTGPDLSGVGIKGVPKGWLASHQKRAAGGAAPGWTRSYGEIPAEDQALLEGYLLGLGGAPALRDAKVLANRLGCRGCHKIQGVGGTEGPDLTREGLIDPATRDFAGVQGPHTEANWLYQHFLAPGRVVPGSLMADQSITPQQAESLTLYMLSLRASEEDGRLFWPRDRLRVARLGERDIAADGETLFGAFCAGCHGPEGQGRRYANIGVVFPAIGSPDFLANASDELIRNTVVKGRPGRKMPAWGEVEGGLTADEIDAVTAWLRARVPAATGEDIPLVPGDAARGARQYASYCQGCHGAGAAGAEAPSLSNRVLLESATDQFLARTILRGRAGTQMRAFGRPQPGFPTLDAAQASDLIAYLRSLAAPGEAAPKGN